MTGLAGEIIGWSCVAVLLGFNFLTDAILHLRRMGRQPSSAQRWTFRVMRALLWPAYVALVLNSLMPAQPIDVVVVNMIILLFIGRMVFKDWMRSKGLDDDDWTKRLVEWGQGVVERVGNKLTVVVPAPAGA